MMSCCGLIDGIPYLRSADHAQHILLGAENHNCCICLCPLIRSLLPRSGGLSQLCMVLKSPRTMSLSVQGVAEIKLSRSS